MLPHDYPDDFSHANLLDEWFTGIPWSCQDAVMRLDSRLRYIRNPRTNVFVVVLRLSPDDKVQRHPFFGVAVLVGWLPIVETQRGQPVEAVHRLIEGMQKSAEIFDAHYGETPDTIAAALRSDRDAAETARVNAMLESTAFAKRFAREFQMKSLAHSVSNAKGLKLYEDAGREFRKELERRDKLASGQPLVVPA